MDILKTPYLSLNEADISNYNILFCYCFGSQLLFPVKVIDFWFHLTEKSLLVSID